MRCLNHGEERAVQSEVAEWQIATPNMRKGEGEEKSEKWKWRKEGERLSEGVE